MRDAVSDVPVKRCVQPVEFTLKDGKKLLHKEVAVWICLLCKYSLPWAQVFIFFLFRPSVVAGYAGANKVRMKSLPELLHPQVTGAQDEIAFCWMSK